MILRMCYRWDTRRPGTISVSVSCDLAFELVLSPEGLATINRVSTCCLLPAIEHRSDPRKGKVQTSFLCSACGLEQSFLSQSFRMDCAGSAPGLAELLDETLQQQGTCCLSAQVQSLAFVDQLATDLRALRANLAIPCGKMSLYPPLLKKLLKLNQWRVAS